MLQLAAGRPGRGIAEEPRAGACWRSPVSQGRRLETTDNRRKTAGEQGRPIARRPGAIVANPTEGAHIGSEWPDGHAGAARRRPEDAARAHERPAGTGGHRGGRDRRRRARHRDRQRPGRARGLDDQRGGHRRDRPGRHRTVRRRSCTRGGPRRLPRGRGPPAGEDGTARGVPPGGPGEVPGLSEFFGGGDATGDDEPHRTGT